jgi:hypothetical protein
VNSTSEIAEQEFRDRMSIEGWLSQHLAEHLWGLYGTLRLGADDFAIADPEDIAGFDPDDGPVLIRRKTDGKIFEIDIEVQARAARMTAATTTTGTAQ